MTTRSKPRAGPGAPRELARRKRAGEPATSESQDVQGVLTWLQRQANAKIRAGMARYAIPSDKAFGISVGSLRKYAKALAPDHALAAALWESGWYEARLLATFVDDAALVTPAQMERWCKDFDSWAIVDTACFHLFDRTPHAFRKVDAWATKRGEFQKRAAFALLASLALHDKAASSERFLQGLALVQSAAQDERNFVKKGVSWALRAIGERDVGLHRAALALGQRLAASDDPTERWVGKDALKGLGSAALGRRLSKRAR